MCYKLRARGAWHPPYQEGGATAHRGHPSYQSLCGVPSQGAPPDLAIGGKPLNKGSQSAGISIASGAASREATQSIELSEILLAGQGALMKPIAKYDLVTEANP